MPRRPRPTDDPSPPMPDTLTGTVVRVVEERGFGFIRVDDGREFFFHRSGTHDFDGLVQGAAVRFVPGVGQKGPRAESVSRVD